MKIFASSFLACVVFARLAAAQPEQPRVSEIVASGRGEVRVTPNKAILVMIVENRAPSASDAASQTARGVASTIAALKAAGAAANQITNGGYSVSADDVDRNTRKPKAFIARNSVRVEADDISNVGKYIDVALASGATQVQPIQFTGPNLVEARREALRRAVAESKSDAQALAAAAGGSLGILLSVSTPPAQPMYRPDYEVVVTGMATGGATPTSIAPNDLVVAAIVNAKWEFIPRR